MVQLVARKRYGPIGIELSTRSLQMIQFTADQKKLIDVVRWDLPAPREDASAEDRARDMAEAITRARLGRKFRGREAVVCLSPKALFVQNIRVLKGPDLQKTVQQEAASRMPFPVDEAEIRFLSVSDVRQGEQTKREVILMACHRTVIEQMLSVIDQAGLRAAAVEVEPSALLRSYVKQFRRDGDKAARSMFVRVGSTNTTVVIAQGMEVFFVKYIDVGGDQMDEAVAKHLKISLEEAGTLRRHNGDRRADQQDPDVARTVSEATRPVIERLMSELSLCIRYHSVTFRGQTLARLVLGGIEAVQSLVDCLSMRLDVRCELGDPLRSYESSPSAQRRGQWDVATGLALRDFE